MTQHDAICKARDCEYVSARKYFCPAVLWLARTP